MTRSCLNICSCNTTWLLPSSRFSRRELRDTVLVAEHQWRLLLLNTQFISELQNYLYRRIMVGSQSDMHGQCKKTPTRSQSSHTDSSPLPNYFKKSEFEPALAITMWKKWYIFPVFAIVTVIGASFQSQLIWSANLNCQYQTSDYLSTAAFGSYHDFNWVVARSFLTWQVIS